MLGEKVHLVVPTALWHGVATRLNTDLVLLRIVVIGWVGRGKGGRFLQCLFISSQIPALGKSLLIGFQDELHSITHMKAVHLGMMQKDIAVELVKRLFANY